MGSLLKILQRLRDKTGKQKNENKKTFGENIVEWVVHPSMGGHFFTFICCQSFLKRRK